MLRPPSMMAHFRLVIPSASYRKGTALAFRRGLPRYVIDAPLIRTDACRAESRKGPAGYRRGLSEAIAAHAECAAGTRGAAAEKRRVERRPRFHSRGRQATESARPATRARSRTTICRPAPGIARRSP